MYTEMRLAIGSIKDIIIAIGSIKDIFPYLLKCFMLYVCTENYTIFAGNIQTQSTLHFYEVTTAIILIRIRIYPFLIILSCNHSFPVSTLLTNIVKPKYIGEIALDKLHFKKCRYLTLEIKYPAPRYVKIVTMD